MTGDLPAAALRLLAALPVRRHEAKLHAPRINAHHLRPVIVSGRRYESMTEAARQLGINRETIRRRISEGRSARYAEPHE